MAKKTSTSRAAMEAIFGHALVQPTAKSGEGTAEATAAERLGVQVLGSAGTSPGLRTWRVRGKDGKPAALVTLAATVTPEERERVARTLVALHAASKTQTLPGVLPVHAMTDEQDAFLTDLWTTGTAKDLSALKWPLRKRVEFVATVARAIAKLHAAGLTHGCLCPDNVLLDDDLQPVLSEAGLVDVRALLARRDALGYETFAAPELRSGAAPSPAADQYSIGRLLQELTAGDDKLPPSLAQVVQRCVSPPQSRYATVDEIVTALQAAASALATVEDVRSAPEPRKAPNPERRERAVAPPSASPSPEATDRHAMNASAPWEMPEPPAWLGIAGMLALAAGLGLGAVLGGANTAVRPLLEVLVPLGAALATTLLPPLPRRRATARVVLALGVAALILKFDPLSFAFRVAAQAHLKGSPDAQHAAVEEILRLGRDFRGLSMVGANLEQFDMTGADLRGVDLTGADLRGTKLVAAEVDGTKLEGAALAGADLSSTQLQLAVMGFALCDEQTRFPSGFFCESGHIARR